MFTNKTIFDAARKVRLDGKNVLITGANTGWGRYLLNVSVICL